MQVPRIEEYYRYSNEKEVLSELLTHELKGNYRSALDVGAGNGRISQILSVRSRKLSLCEPNEYYQKTLKEKFPTATLMTTPIQNASLENYDCILASQSMYYHVPENWISVIERLMGHLNEGGDLHLIVNSDQGDWWQAVKGIWSVAPEALGFNYFPSSRLIQKLSETYHLKTKRFAYQMQFPDRSSLENYIRRSCIPLKTKTPELESILESYLQSIPVDNLRMNYFSDLISLKRVK